MKSMREMIKLMEGVLAVPAVGKIQEAKFQNVSCSQCGQEFGPGDNGYSHCSDHEGKIAAKEGVDDIDYSMSQGEMGNPDRAMEEDLNNGYHDTEVMSGNDFFPNGADSPVVSAVGPSGARQGDNPMQKKMQVAEVHKELVYDYRNFLKESATKKKK